MANNMKNFNFTSNLYFIFKSIYLFILEKEKKWGERERDAFFG